MYVVRFARVDGKPDEEYWYHRLEDAEYERVRSGMANAKAKGAKIGRPQATADDIPANFLRHYPAYKSKQLNVSELARVCDISRTTAYKYIGLLEQA